MAHDTQYRSSVTTRSTQSKKAGKPQGQWKTGKVYNGDWHHDKRQGFGTHKIGRTVTSMKAIGIKTNVTGKGRFGLRKALACENSTLVTGWII